MKKKIIAGVLSALLLTTSISVFAQETSLLNTSYEELLLISSKLNNDNATLRALLQINTSLNEANERMDTEDYKPAEVIAQATMIRTALDGVDTNLSQSGYDANSSQRVIVSQMKNTINEINAKAGSKYTSGGSQSQTPSQTPSVKPMSFQDFNWNNVPMQFSDVPSNAWFYNDVSNASAAGIIDGIGNGQFNPDGTLTHAEAMTLMAKVHAIYLYGNSNIINEYQKTDDHWASGIHSYCLDHKLPTPNVSDFDTNITRGTMARYFRNSLPSKAFDTGISNDLSLMPEQTTNTIVQDLFKSGIMVGDHSGFRLDDSITRAEAAAIIHRVANPDVRVKVTPPAQPQQPTTPVQPQQPVTPQQPVSPVQPGQVQSAKPYKNIPNTNWQSDPTGGVTITSQSGYINTKYGNHTYGCANQQEYDKVMSVMDEAYNYAIQKEAQDNHRGDIIKDMASQKNKMAKFYREQVGFTSDYDVASMRITENVVRYMHDYLVNTYATPNGKGTNTDVQNNNVYKYLFAGGYLDCDGMSNFNMLCYDYLGFSTRMLGSNKIHHASTQVYVNGQWIISAQGTGKLENCTHTQLLQLISGVKNDAYSTSFNSDSFIQNASDSLDSGDKSYCPDDIIILSTPTHNPSDRNLR